MVKISFDKGASVIVVDVLIKHKTRRKKVRMAFDTGATYMMIPWEVAESIEKVLVVELLHVRIGNTEASSVKAMVHDLPPKSYVDGLLGLSFLRNFNLHINFKDGYFELN